MRIVKISELSDEEKKKILQRKQENARISEQNRINANNQFNELISKNGLYDTSKHTTTIGNLKKAYNNNDTTKKSLDNYYKANKTSLWQDIQNLASATGKIGENTLLNAESGVLSSIQTLGRNMFNVEGRKQEAEMWDAIHQRVIDKETEGLNQSEKRQIYKKIDNNPFSYSNMQKNLVQGIEEKNQGLQEKINENTLKTQQNAESISNPVGKYIAGEIAPSIGQMLPGMLPVVGTPYFITSATGNYYNDAKQRGMTESQATMYSGVMGIIEGSLEAVGAKLTTNVGKQLLKKNIKGALVNYGLDIGENFLEESIVEPISELVAGATGGKDKADWSNIGKRMWESGVAGAITSIIAGGASGAAGAIGSKITQQNQYTDYNTNKKLDKNSQNLLKEAENIIQKNSTSNLQQNRTNNQNNTNNQQIIPTEQKTAQNGISEQVKIDSKNFAKQVDAIKNGTFPQRDMLTLGKTPQVLKDIGLPDLPITMTQRHLDTIMNESGKYKNANYHGLGEEIVKQLPEAINNPLDIVKSNTKDDSIVLTTYLADKNDNTVIASIKIDGTGKINNIEIDSNVLTSAYGRNNYEKFMEENIKNGNLLYDIDRGVIKKVTGARLQLPRTSNSSTGARLQLPRRDASITNSIPQNTKNVNDNTIVNNYSMQENKNNSTIDNRGRKLTIEQQEYFKDSKVRDENGNMLVMYHGSKHKFDEFNSAVNWFTDAKEYSRYYGREQNAIQKTLGLEAKKSKYTYKTYLNIKNPKVLGNIDGYINQDFDVKEFLEGSNISREDFNKLLKKFNKGKSRNERAYRIYEITNSEIFKNYLIKQGYDGIKANEKGYTSYAAFYPEQIKNIKDNNLGNSIMENKTNQNIANNEEMNYTNIESESGINERYKRDTIEAWNGIYEEYKHEEDREYTWEEYNKWEQAIKPIETNKLTNSERQSIESAKLEYNKDIILYDEKENDNTYSGGASREVKGKITISRQSAEVFGLNKIIDHENVESDILHNDVARDILSNVIDIIKEDDNFKLQKENFWKEQKGNIPTDDLIAKDIICDRFSEIKQKEKVDYENVLSNATNSILDNALINYYFQVYGKELDIPSSFSMPTKQNTIKLPQKESNVDKYNKYKKNILKARETEINNLIQNKNETITELEQKIEENEKILSSKKDKTTKVANNLKMQIENLKQRKDKIENEYLGRIDRKNDKVTKDKINLETKKELGITRKEIQQNLLENTGILNESLDNAKNISMANMNRTDPIRLQEKVFGRKLGTKINDMFFNIIKHNTAEKTRFSNSERNDIKNWGIKARSFESEVLQKYTEKTYVTEDGKEILYTEADLIKDVTNEETRNKIRKASEELRKKYDYYIELANEVLVGLGYDAIPKRKDYVRHFTELNDIFTKFGIPGKLDNALPTDINGITDTFRPGKNFFANAQKRHGNKTTYDAITGIDGYIDGISNLIYHTEDMQRLRALDKYIRENYGEKGFENLDNLPEEDKKVRMKKISENHLSNYVSWLTEYTNNLAGKKSGIDRSVEKLLGRNIYSALDTIKKQTGSNMTGFNIGSALTNFISVTQGASKTNKLALLKGTANTIQNIFNNDGFVDRSDFLTNRFGSDRISNTLWQKASNVGHVFMNATDYFTSNLIVRSKYYENLAKGMSETEALKKADDFGARILGDRSQGSTATVFNSKMLGIVTQFQLEVNNQLDTMIHDTIQDFKTTADESGSLKASMGAVWTLGQMAVYQYAFNEIFQAIAGRRPAFDIIDIIKTAFGLDDDEDDKDSTLYKVLGINKKNNDENQDSLIDNLFQATGKLIDALPFVNLLSEDSRLPISSSVPNLLNVVTGDSTLKDELPKLIYLLPPTGGSQAKKSIDGIKTVIDGGSYVTNSKGEKELRFPVENTTTANYIKAGIFGKYSLPTAQDYIDRDYKRLSAKQTKTYEESNLPYKEYLEYIEAGLKKTEDKINYLESKEMTTEQRWGIYKNDLFSDSIREKDGSSQLKDAEYITSNGISKSEYIKLYNKAKKNEIDMPTADEYKEMKSHNISLSNYLDYKIKVKNMTEQKRKTNELSETQNLKNTDKIQILLDSNYSDKEISAIYDSYIKSEKDTEYDIMEAAGINIKEYLKYKQQDFESDYYDDGTLKGKTVSKSKQKKVVAYLNSMKIKGNQRLLLYAMQGYSMTSAQKTQLAKYVYDLKVDKESKLKLYDKFSGFTVYKNGQIRW